MNEQATVPECPSESKIAVPPKTAVWILLYTYNSMHESSVVPIIGSAIRNSRLLGNFVTIRISTDSKATISAY